MVWEKSNKHVYCVRCFCKCCRHASFCFGGCVNSWVILWKGVSVWRLETAWSTPERCRGWSMRFRFIQERVRALKCIHHTLLFPPFILHLGKSLGNSSPDSLFLIPFSLPIWELLKQIPEQSCLIKNTRCPPKMSIHFELLIPMS